MSESSVIIFQSLQILLGVIFLLIIPKVMYLVAIVLDNYVGEYNNRFINYVDTFSTNLILVISKFIFSMFAVVTLIYLPLLDIVSDESVKIGTLEMKEGKKYVDGKRVLFFGDSDSLQEGEKVKYTLRTRYLIKE